MQRLLVARQVSRLAGADADMVDPLDGRGFPAQDLLDRVERLVGAWDSSHECDTSCYACLRGYRNQIWHEKLSRRDARAVLAAVQPGAFVVFDVPQRTLMQLAGLMVAKNVGFHREAVLFAARSEPFQKLTAEENSALEAFVAVLSEQEPQVDK